MECDGLQVYGRLGLTVVFRPRARMKNKMISAEGFRTDVRAEEPIERLSVLPRAILTVLLRFFLKFFQFVAQALQFALTLFHSPI